MAYTLGRIAQFSAKFTASIGYKDRGRISGIEAFVRRPDGKYQQVLLSEKSNNEDHVDGNYEGFFGSYNFDTMEQARREAQKAYRWLNR